MAERKKHVLEVVHEKKQHKLDERKVLEPNVYKARISKLGTTALVRDFRRRFECAKH